MNPAVLAHAAELAQRREPFVLATVVWRREPSSGKPGSTAVILADGTMQGWLGGACAEPTIVEESLQALTTGEPRLLLIGAIDERTQPADGARRVPMACASEGALEVYLEPMLPAPRVVVVGRSPAVRMLAALAEALGWPATVVDRDAAGAGVDVPAAGAPAAGEAGAGGGRVGFDGVDASTCIVVATQGHYDEDALEAALATDAGYVGLVASRARAAEVRNLLADRGVSSEALDRIQAPAGLDLGRIDHEEIAVAVLAELVARRAAGELGDPLRAAAGAALATKNDAIDPVCKMTVDAATTHHRAEYRDTTYYFCAAGCRQQFEADPARFVG